MTSTYSPVDNESSYSRKVIKTLIKIVHDIDNVAITIYSFNVDLPKLAFTAQTLIIVHVDGITRRQNVGRQVHQFMMKPGIKKSASYTYTCNLQHLSLQLNVTSSNMINRLHFL